MLFLVGSWAAVVLVALLLGLAAVAWEHLIPGGYERVWPVNLAASLTLAALLVHGGVPLGWLPAAVAIGWAGVKNPRVHEESQHPGWPEVPRQEHGATGPRSIWRHWTLSPLSEVRHGRR